jgi:hypothetical protein
MTDAGSTSRRTETARRDRLEEGQRARFLVHMSLQGKRSVPSPGSHYRIVADIVLNVVNVPRFLKVSVPSGP